MPLLLLIRHGENEYVKTGKLAGRLPGVNLNEKGQKQAQALGEALKECLSAVYSVPERAMQTAQPIADRTDFASLDATMDTHIGKWRKIFKISGSPIYGRSCDAKPPGRRSRYRNVMRSSDRSST
jgi:broad specificity phosphatase PhoE